MEQRTQVRGEPAEDEEIGADFIARLRRRETSDLHHFFVVLIAAAFLLRLYFRPKEKRLHTWPLRESSAAFE